MASTNTQKQAAKAFVQEWSGKGYEKGETQRFWMALLHDVLGVENPVKAMEFEIPVKTITKEKGSDFIDGYITATKVLIEQKGSNIWQRKGPMNISPSSTARVTCRRAGTSTVPYPMPIIITWKPLHV